MRIFDCLLYNGEIDTLEIRLHELAASVDAVVIVEATRTFSGRAKPLRLRSQWARIHGFAQKIRYVIIDDDIDGDDPWEREKFQRNCITRGLIDSADEDLILVSDVDEIPRASVIDEIKQAEPGCFGLVLDLSYFALNYVHQAGPEVDLITAIVCPYALLKTHEPNVLRHAFRNETWPSQRVRNAGWHFSYLSDLSGIKRKIRDFSHQEYNTPEFLEKIDPFALIAARQDLFGRPDYVWDIAGEEQLPAHVRANRDRFAHRILTQQGFFVGGEPAGAPDDGCGSAGPIILCPYVHDADRARVVAAFGLDREHGRRLPFHLWQDKELLGPERAYEQGWKAFPGRDVIILHTDMAPMPDDGQNSWYDRLLAQVEALPGAGLIGCDLLYPLRAPTGEWYVQCAGGWFEDRRIGHVGGSVDLSAAAAGAAAYRYDARYRTARPVDWITFGGAYIRREVIDMVGDFDPGYRWAYVMDADYAIEARVRGARCWQVPVTLLHQENGSTRPLLNDPNYADKVKFNYDFFRSKWEDLFWRTRDNVWIGSRSVVDPPSSSVAREAPHESRAVRWFRAHQAAFLAEARARGVDFAGAAYLRALGLAEDALVTIADVRRAYNLVLGRDIDAGGEATWNGHLLQNEVRAGALLQGLCSSQEYLSLSDAHAPQDRVTP